jgi:Fe-S-cluster containining protein
MATYDCDLCGACCRTFPIYVTEADAQREPRIRSEGKKLAAHLQTQSWRFQLFPLPFQNACSFLARDERCTIYQTRPDVCRRFDAGSEQCQEARLRSGLVPLLPIANDAGSSTEN